MKRWDPQDCPWVEHIKWFPNCGHVLLVKGKKFVDKVQQALKNKEKLANSKKKIILRPTTQIIKPVIPVPDLWHGLCRLDTSTLHLLAISDRELKKKDKEEEEVVEDVEEKKDDQVEEKKDDHLCCICLENKADIVFIPCGHLSTCGRCTTNIKDCCVCRTNITQCVKVFLS